MTTATDHCSSFGLKSVQPSSLSLSSSSSTLSLSSPLLSLFSTSINQHSSFSDVVTMSRKRTAALRLPRIHFRDAGLVVDLDENLSSGTSVITGDPSHQEDNEAKRPRAPESSPIQHEHFTLSELSDSNSKSPCRYKEKGASKQFHSWPEVNNTIVCGYQLVGAGKEFTAFHLEKKVVKTCQVIDNEQYLKLLSIRNRLNDAEKFWEYDDVNEMREFVLPSSIEVHVDEKGRKFCFAPWQYGTLHCKANPSKTTLSVYEASMIFKQIVRGMAFCHAAGILVRNVILRKFVFVDKNLKRIRLRDVFDLHVCSDVNNDGLRDRHSCPAYVAPELLKDSMEYAGRPADIWALGVLLYVLLFGCYPFNDVTPQRLFSRILKAKFCIPVQTGVSHAARALIFGMLKKDPFERPTAEQLLHAPWSVDDDKNSSMFLNSVRFMAAETSLSSISSPTPAFNFAAFIGAVSPTLEVARSIIRTGYESNDQVVPSIASPMHSVRRKLLPVRSLIGVGSDIVADGGG